MKRFIVRLSLAFAAVSLLLGMSYGILIGSIGDDPHGKFASYEFFPHHKNDVLRFREGKVRLKTCCGDEDYGLYRKDESGQWIWTFQQQRRPKDRSKWYMTPPRTFLLKRSWFSLEIVEMEAPSVKLSMRSRLFKTWPL